MVFSLRVQHAHWPDTMEIIYLFNAYNVMWLRSISIDRPTQWFGLLFRFPFRFLLRLIGGRVLANSACLHRVPSLALLIAFLICSVFMDQLTIIWVFNDLSWPFPRPIMRNLCLFCGLSTFIMLVRLTESNVNGAFWLKWPWITLYFLILNWVLFKLLIPDLMTK